MLYCYIIIGQVLGGTHKKRGRDKGFTDKTHILYEIIWYYKCRPIMHCSRNLMSSLEYDITEGGLNKTTSSDYYNRTRIDNHSLLKYMQDKYYSNNNHSNKTHSTSTTSTSTSMNDQDLTVCYTAVFVICKGASEDSKNENDGNKSPTNATLPMNYTIQSPLWNLHVHSKNTNEFKSRPCNCNTAID